jgi:hypothetical protein
MALRLLAHRRLPVTIEASLPAVLETRNVAVFDPRMERSYEPAVNRLRMQDLSLAALDLLIIRESQHNALQEIDQDDVLASYLTDIPVLVLCGSHDAESPAPVLRPPAWAVPFDAQLAAVELRGPELEAMLRRSTAIQRQPGCHYALPSTAAHAAQFIRLANALQDATDLLRLADWILPFVGDRVGLAADTGTLLGLLAVVRDEALRRFDWEVPIAALDEYPRGPDAVQALLDNFAITGWESLVFALSVNSTGGVAREVARREPQAQILALCETATDAGERAEAAGGEGPTEVFLDYPIARWRLNADRRCDQCPSEELLHVHPETYEVTAQIEWMARGFDQAQIEAEKSFWEIADRAGAVSLHLDHTTSTGAREEVRHLSVSLDIAALLEDSEFSDRCTAVLADCYPRPDLILVPEHGSAAALARLAQSVWDSPLFTIPLGRIEGDARAALADARDVLVMDDVVISAQTLFGLRTRIYEVAQEGQHDVRVWGFVPLARTSTSEGWDRIRQRYMAATSEGFKHGLYAAQEILLPPPGVADCPWCRERVLLQRILPTLAGDGDAERIALERETRLRRTPLAPPLGLDGVAGETRTDGSMVGDLRPAAAFAFAAALAQHLKDDLSHRRQVAEIPYFNIELLLTAVFDAAVFGGILRTFDPRHVRDPTHEQSLADCLLGKEWEPGMLAELAIGAAEGKLPLDTVLQAIDEQAGDEHNAATLRAIAHRSAA